MSLANVFPSLRKALRQRLVTCVDVDSSPGVSVVATSGVYVRASGSWLDDGFAIGQELTITGMGSANAGPVSVLGLSANGLTLTTSGTGSATSSSGRFVAALPGLVAYEGVTFRPDTDDAAGRPYVAEVFQPGQSGRRTLGDNPLISHPIQAHYTLMYPSGDYAPVDAVERMAGALMAHFIPNLTLTYGGVGARVGQVRRSQLFQDGAWLSCTVTVEMTAWT